MSSIQNKEKPRNKQLVCYFNQSNENEKINDLINEKQVVANQYFSTQKT